MHLPASPSLSISPVSSMIRRQSFMNFPTSEGDPYYPIPRPENGKLYKQYQDLAASTPQVIFAGRLGTYKYYNMDQVVAQALAVFGRIVKAERQVQQQGGFDQSTIIPATVTTLKKVNCQRRLRIEIAALGYGKSRALRMLTFPFCLHQSYKFRRPTCREATIILVSPQCCLNKRSTISG